MTRFSALLDPSWLLTLAIWPILAVAAGSLLPAPPDEPTTDTSVAWQGTTSLSIALDAPNPCNAEPTALDGAVAVQTAVRPERDGGVSVSLDAAFENAGQIPTADRLIPIREQYTFAVDGPSGDGQPTHVRRVDVPLTDRLSGSHLGLKLVSTLAPNNRVLMRLAEVSLVCDPLYNETTPQ
jgi:hypothetical protein